MSRITDIMITTFIDESVFDNVKLLNEYLKEKGHGQFNLVSDHAGGRKVMTTYIFLLSESSLWVEKFVEFFNTLKWETPEEVELFIKEQEDEIFTVYRVVDLIGEDDDFKDCPFCGGTANNFTGIINQMDLSNIFCKNCGVKTPTCDSLEEATKIWNNRYK